MSDSGYLNASASEHMVLMNSACSVQRGKKKMSWHPPLQAKFPSTRSREGLSTASAYLRISCPGHCRLQTHAALLSYIANVPFQKCDPFLRHYVTPGQPEDENQGEARRASP